MMRLMSIIFCIAVGGGFGALAREGTMSLMHGTVGLPAYVSLGIVNVVGSLLIGIIFSRMESSLNRNGGSRLQHLPHAKRLQHLPWWPDGDPTLPAVDILRCETALQIGSALMITGFLGAYTTFSAFCLLTVQLLEKGEVVNALISVVGSITLGLAAAWIGVHIGCWLSRRGKKAPAA